MAKTNKQAIKELKGYWLKNPQTREDLKLSLQLEDRGFIRKIIIKELTKDLTKGR